MARTPNLNEVVSWDRVFPLLGLDAGTGALPFTGPCPFCGGRLSTQKCTTDKGEWHSCLSCLFEGDTIELAARAWGIRPGLAYRRLCAALQEEVAPDVDIASYEEQFVAARARMRELWDKAREYFAKASGECRSLRRRLGLASDSAHRLWRERTGRWVGGASREDIEAVTVPKGDRDCTENLFPGTRREGGYKKWKEAIVLPLFDVGRRITDLVVAAHPNGGDVEYRCVNVLHKMSGPKCVSASGVCVPEALDMPVTDWGGRSLVCLDPFAAVRIQARGQADSDPVLPVSGIWGPYETPRLLRLARLGRELVLWSETWSADLLRHAAVLDARVFIFDSREDLGRVITTRGGCTARYWVRRWLENSVPWAEEAAARLERLPDSGALDDLTQARLSPQAAGQLLDACRPALRSRLEALMTGVARERSAYLRQYVIHESTDGWSGRYRHHGAVGNGKRSVITDTPFRVEQVIYQPRDGKTYYRGVAAWHGREVRFTAPEAFAARPMAWLHKHFIENDLGVTLYNGRWEEDAMAISALFHKPELARGASTYGWDPARRLFAFPSFVLHEDGRAEEATDVPAGPRAPAAGARPPEALGDIDAAALEACPPAWPAALAVLSSLLSPAMSREAGAWAFEGPGAGAALRAAACMGCVDGDDHGPDGWPAIRRPKLSAEGLPGWLADGRRCLTEFQGLEALGVGTYTGWRLLRAPAGTVGLAAIEALARLLPALLQRACRAGLHGDPVEAARQVLASWRTEMGLPKLSLAPASVAACFGEVLARLHEEGGLDFVRADFPGLYKMRFEQSRVHYRDEKVWVPKAAVGLLMRARKAPPPDVPRVTEGLAEAGALVDEVDHLGAPGWLVTESWWNAALSSYRASARTLAGLPRRAS